MNREIILQVEDVSFSYRPLSRFLPRPKRQVFHSLSFDLLQGETLGILGRNGMGKSTLLRLLAGIVAPTSGMIHRKPDIHAALLTLGRGFRPDLTGRDNALLAGMLQGTTREQAISNLDQIDEFAELGSSFDEPVKTYSSGMRSRLGFATALMTEVDILLIDEVLSVGDAHFREKATHALQDRITSSQTVVFVSHAAEQVRVLCDRAIWLEQGTIKAGGNVQEVLKEYDWFVRNLD